MLYDPTATPGQGLRYRCPICNRRINIKPSGRPRRFCCDSCSDEARRKAAQRVSKEARHHPSGDLIGNPRNLPKTLDKSTICQSGFGDPRSLFKPPLSIIAGPSVSVANLMITKDGGVPAKPKLDPAERAELVRRALQLETRVRWDRGGVK